jgi:hypothetical protein
VSNCLGWQQFVLDNDPGNGTALLYMQYWLINYPSNCPSGYTYFTATASLAGGCYMNSAAVSVPLQGMADLPWVTLTGSAGVGVQNQAQIATQTSLYYTTGADAVLNLSTAWTEAEFNIFGNGNGSEAAFASGALASVQIGVGTGTASSTPPTVFVGGTTAETNNLTLSSLTCPVADPNGPYVWFQESYGATPASSCPVTPISLAAPTVTVTGPTGDVVEVFDFSWPSVPGATYYVMSANGDTTITGNSSFVGVACNETVTVEFTSCDAAGCGWPETVLKAKNNSKQCNN